MDTRGDAAAIERSGRDGGRAITLRIPAKPEYITLCRLALTGISRVREIGDETLAELKLALTEAVSNSVRHAYGPNGEGHVEVIVRARARPSRHRGRRRRRGVRPRRSAGDRGRGALGGRPRHRDHPLDRRRVRDPFLARRARLASPVREAPVGRASRPADLSFAARCCSSSTSGTSRSRTTRRSRRTG